MLPLIKKRVPGPNRNTPLSARSGPQNQEELLGAGLPKKDRWLLHYLHEGFDTFLDKTASVYAAGYNFADKAHAASKGSELYHHHKQAIAKWLDDIGLSENKLKAKLAQMLEVEKVQYFAHKGVVVDERVDRDTQAQLKALDMALRVKDMYAPEKLEHSGEIDGEFRVVFVRPGEVNRG